MITQLKVCFLKKNTGCGISLAYFFSETIDYRLGTGRMEFFQAPINQTRCVCIEIIDDAFYKGNRTFNLTLYSDHDFVKPLSEPVSVLIMEDEGNGRIYILMWGRTNHL